MYKCLKHSYYGTPSDYALITITAEAMEPIRVWRNAQLEVLRQERALSAAEQQRYYCEQIVPTFDQEEPEQVLFTFLHHNLPIGYGGLTHIDWARRQAEVSFLLDPQQLDNYATKFAAYLNLLAQVAFEELKLNRLYTETYAFRTEHIAILEGFGFQLEEHRAQSVLKGGKCYDALLHGLKNEK